MPALDHRSAADADAATPPETMRFRILTRGTWKRAIRLESVFWDALEFGARESGQKLTDYVRAVLDDLPEGANATSRLRVHATALLDERLAAARTELAAVDGAGLLRSVPAAGFVVAPGRGLIAHNAEFMAFVRKAAGHRDGDPAPAVRLNLEAPLRSIVGVLRETRPRPLECGYALTVGERVLRGRVRVSLAPGSAATDEILGFVLPQDRAA